MTSGGAGVPDPSIRASDADREAVATALREHLLAGRITMDEFEERVGAAFSATLLSDLAPLTADLPQPQKPATQAPKESPRERRRREKAEKNHGKSLASWQARRDAQAELLRLAREFRGETASDFICNPGEALFSTVTGTALVEHRRQSGQYQGRSGGFSIPLGLGVRYRTGRSRGRYVQGPEVATAIDTGTLYVTNQRVVFRGMKQTRECRYDKTIGISHDDRQGVAVISVSNRQKPMMVRYGPKVAGAVAIRMEMALAQYRGQLPALVARLEQELAAIDQTKPVAPPAAKKSSGVSGTSPPAKTQPTPNTRQPAAGPVKSPPAASNEPWWKQPGLRG